MPENNTKPTFEILNQFIKDLSFEAPSSPKIFFEKIEAAPQIEVGLEVKATPINENLNEVVVHVKIKSSITDQVLFLIELAYAAMVVINTEDKEEKNKISLRVIPSHLFPFIRSLVADITKDSGFAPFILAPIDFDRVEVSPQATSVPTNSK